MVFYRKRYSRRTFRRSYGKRATFRKARKSAARKSVRNAAVKLMVKREVARNVENKSTDTVITAQTIYPVGDTANFDANNVFWVSPGDIFGASTWYIEQGTGAGMRVGNQVKVKKLTFKGVLTPLAYDATTNTNPQPREVKMWFFYQRNSPSVLPSNPRTDFFQSGSSTSGLNDDLSDIVAPVNTDKYVVVATRTFKVGYQQFATTGSSPAYGNFTNNDFKLNCKFSVDLTKHIPKIMKWSDNDNSPMTRGLFCMVEDVAANGGATGTTQRLTGMQYWRSMVYEDA